MVPALLALTLAMVGTTFIHLDPFHLEGPLGAASLAVYGWVASYILVPLSIMFLLPRQIFLGSMLVTGIGGAVTSHRRVQ